MSDRKVWKAVCDVIKDKETLMELVKLLSENKND